MIATNEAEATIRKVLQEGTVLFEQLQRDQDALLRSRQALEKLRKHVQRLEGQAASAPPPDTVEKPRPKVDPPAQDRPKFSLPLNMPPAAAQSAPSVDSAANEVAAAATPFGPAVAKDAAAAVLGMPLGEAEQLERKLKFAFRSAGMSPYMVRLEKETIRLTRQVDKFLLLNKKLREEITELRRHRLQLQVGVDQVEAENSVALTKLQAAIDEAAAATESRKQLQSEKAKLEAELHEVEVGFRKDWGTVVEALDQEIMGMNAGTTETAGDQAPPQPVRVLVTQRVCNAAVTHTRVAAE